MLHAVQRKESLVKSSIENMTDAFFLCQIQWEEKRLTVVEWNQAAEDMFELSKKFSDHQDFVSALPNFKKFNLSTILLDVAQTGKSWISTNVPVMEENL